MFIFVVPPTFFNNRSNFGITSARCFPLSVSLHTEEKCWSNVLFYHIDNKINSLYLFLQINCWLLFDKYFVINRQPLFNTNRKSSLSEFCWNLKPRPNGLPLFGRHFGFCLSSILVRLSSKKCLSSTCLCGGEFDKHFAWQAKFHMFAKQFLSVFLGLKECFCIIKHLLNSTSAHRTSD